MPFNKLFFLLWNLVFLLLICIFPLIRYSRRSSSTDKDILKLPSNGCRGGPLWSKHHSPDCSDGCFGKLFIQICMDLLTIIIINLKNSILQGDLAKKKIYPTLWMLFRDKLIPDKTFIYGYSRSKLTMEQLKSNVSPYLKVG